MALIQTTYTWSDGSTMTVTVRGKARYPDALSDLGAQAARRWVETMDALGIVIQAETAEPSGLVE